MILRSEFSLRGCIVTLQIFVILMEARMQNFKIGREVLKRVPYDLAIFRNFHHYLKIGIFLQKCSCNNASFLDFDGCVNSLS